MLNGSIKKYPEPVSSYRSNLEDDYDIMYSGYPYYGRPSTLTEQYRKLNEEKEKAIAHGFHLGVRVTVIRSGRTGVINQYAFTLKDGVDILENYTPLGILFDDETIVFYSESEIEEAP
jgi:hypothetical protein